METIPIQHHVNQATLCYFINLSEKQLSCIQQLSLCCADLLALAFVCTVMGPRVRVCEHGKCPASSPNSLMPLKTKLEDHLRVGSLHDHRSWPAMVGPFHQRWFPALCPKQGLAQLPIQLGTERNAALEEVADEIFDLGFAAQVFGLGLEKKMKDIEKICLQPSILSEGSQDLEQPKTSSLCSLHWNATAWSSKPRSLALPHSSIGLLHLSGHLGATSR